MRHGGDGFGVTADDMHGTGGTAAVPRVAIDDDEADGDIGHGSGQRV